MCTPTPKPPAYVPFRDSVYNDGTIAEEVPNTSVLTIVDLYRGTGTAPSMVIDTKGNLVGSLDLSGDDVSNVVASPFPSSGDPAKSFSLVDRGEFTSTQIADGRAWYVANNADPSQIDVALPDHCRSAMACDSSGFPVDHTGPRSARNEDRHPLRYTYEVDGSLAGASGDYTCAYEMSDEDSTCRVTNQNDHFRFIGPWVFTPAASSRVRVDDAEFMYFGWWARQTNTDGSWDYRTFHGPTETGADGNRSTGGEMSQLSGSATYQGPAVGHYSFYQPLTAQSEYGEFNATATLTADFEEDEVHGFIDDFDVHSDWHLTLKHGDIETGDNDAATTGNDGTVTDNPGGVSWRIDGEADAAPDTGSWEAAFYSDLPSAEQQRTSTDGEEDAVPTGMAGTFEAAYHNVGRIIGAFGARKQP